VHGKTELSVHVSCGWLAYCCNLPREKLFHFCFRVSCDDLDCFVVVRNLYIVPEYTKTMHSCLFHLFYSLSQVGSAWSQPAPAWLMLSIFVELVRRMQWVHVTANQRQCLVQSYLPFDSLQTSSHDHVAFFMIVFDDGYITNIAILMILQKSRAAAFRGWPYCITQGGGRLLKEVACLNCDFYRWTRDCHT